MGSTIRVQSINISTRNINNGMAQDISSKEKSLRKTARYRPFTESSPKQPSTPPIPCAPPSKDELSELRLEAELQEKYEIATIQMYFRIQSARSRNNDIIPSRSNIETPYQTISNHSRCSRGGAHTSSPKNNMSQLGGHVNYDEQFAFEDLEM